MSPYLEEFFIEVNDWVDSGCPDHLIFSKDAPLCLASTRWCDSHKLKLSTLHLELIALFKANELNPILPFNNSAPEYFLERNCNAVYSNPRRLAFIRRHAA